MLSALLLAALVKLNLVLEKPVVPALAFALIALVMGLLLDHPLIGTAVAAPINFGLGFLFFRLLKRTEGEWTWWVVLILGIAFFFGLSFVSVGSKGSRARVSALSASPVTERIS